ncbi:MAG: hypothetical protein AAF721_04190 [Myxococcota bacterium]
MRWWMCLLLPLLGCERAPQPSKVSPEPGAKAAVEPAPGAATGNQEPPLPLPEVETSRPSAATRSALAVAGEVEFVSFLPAGVVADQLAGYFGELGVELREVDRFVAVEEAKRHKVRNDGVLLVVKGEHAESILVPSDPRRAAKALARLDRSVERALVRQSEPLLVTLIRWGPAPEVGPARSALRELLRSTGASVTELDWATAGPTPLAPGTIAIVVDAGRRPLAPLTDALTDLLAAGGSAFVALAPTGKEGLGRLAERTGVDYDPRLVASERHYVVMNRTESDHLNLVTDRVDKHPIIGSVAPKAGMMFPEVGSLKLAPEQPKSRCVVRTRSDAFIDADGSLTRGEDETAAELPLVCVYEEGSSRAVFVAGAAWLADAVLQSGGVPLQKQMLLSSIFWLAGRAGTEPPAGGAEVAKAYPLRGPEPPAPKPLWSAPVEAVSRIEFVQGDRRLTLERSADGVELISVEAGAEQRFAGGRNASRVFEWLAAPQVVRRLQVPAQPGFGFSGDDAATVTVVVGETTHTLRTGAFAVGDVYVQDSEGLVSVIRGRWLRPLQQPATLRERSPR